MNDVEKKSSRAKNSAIASRLGELIDKVGMTSEEFAETLNIGAETIKKARASKNPNPLVLENGIAICKKYNISLDYLYGLDPDPNNDAENLIAVCEKTFNLKKDDKGNYTAKVNKNVIDLLLAIEEADTGSRKANLPDNIHKLWVDSKKDEYNEKIKLNPSEECIEYDIRKRGEFEKEKEEAIADVRSKYHRQKTPEAHYPR